jgi:hypothetical protein
MSATIELMVSSLAKAIRADIEAELAPVLKQISERVYEKAYGRLAALFVMGVEAQPEEVPGEPLRPQKPATKAPIIYSAEKIGLLAGMFLAKHRTMSYSKEVLAENIGLTDPAADASLKRALSKLCKEAVLARERIGNTYYYTYVGEDNYNSKDPSDPVKYGKWVEVQPGNQK